MRFVCTIYGMDANSSTPVAAPPAPTDQATTRAARTVGGFIRLAEVTIDGRDARQAAARAYTHTVGKDRAQVMRGRPDMPRSVIAQETSFRAIGLSLRKTKTEVGA